MDIDDKDNDDRRRSSERHHKGSRRHRSRERRHSRRERDESDEGELERPKGDGSVKRSRSRSRRHREESASHADSHRHKRRSRHGDESMSRRRRHKRRRHRDDSKSDHSEAGSTQSKSKHRRHRHTSQNLSTSDNDGPEPTFPQRVSPKSNKVGRKTDYEDSSTDILSHPASALAPKRAKAESESGEIYLNPADLVVDTEPVLVQPVFKAIASFYNLEEPKKEEEKKPSGPSEYEKWLSAVNDNKGKSDGVLKKLEHEGVVGGKAPERIVKPPSPTLIAYKPPTCPW
jgi:hypothetical protein